ncbi:MAG: helix-turn-helix domain-containing protein [Elusimicrobia bacterium]|nr:helix-turn-helix domain-containing protein [Elusimicrobiota bacterium]
MDGIGKIIQEQRELKKLTLEEVHLKTRIARHFLTAIEADDRSVFPAEVYYLGTIRTYARFLGLDGGPLVLQVQSPVPVPEKPLDIRPLIGSVPKKPVTKKTIIAGTLVLLVLAAAVVFYWHSCFSCTALGQKPLPQSLPALSPVAAVAIVPAPIIRTTIELRITAVKNTWVKVVSDGKIVQESTMFAGAQRTWQANAGYRVVVGHAAGVSVEVNGEPIKLPISSPHIAQLVITKAGTRISIIDSPRPQAVQSVDTTQSTSAVFPVIVSSPTVPAGKKHQ